MLKEKNPKNDFQNLMLGLNFGGKYKDMLALQRNCIALAKKQSTPQADCVGNADDDGLPGGALQPADGEPGAKMVPLPLALQGPAAVALKLVTDANCTEEQIDAVALLAVSFQKRFDARPDKTSHMLPVATPENNHRAVWLGGGGVGKTRTLREVVEPLAICYFGDNGYSATAQSNAAAQNLGPRGRTMHSTNGYLEIDLERIFGLPTYVM